MRSWYTSGGKSGLFKSQHKFASDIFWWTGINENFLVIVEIGRIMELRFEHLNLKELNPRTPVASLGKIKK